MPNERKGFFHNKKIILLAILNTIEENPNMNARKLIAKLNVNEPYISEAMAYKTLKNLVLDGQIKIDAEQNICLTK